VRHPAVASTACLAVSLLWPAAAAPSPHGPRVRFPRDHYGHRAGIEWWYVSGDVRGSDGRRYSVFFTLFARGGLVLVVSQVVDLDSGRLVGHSERVGAAEVGATRLAVRLASDASLAYRPGANRWSAAARSGSYRLSFAAVPVKPYVLHGDGGVIRQGPSRSFYYSATRMRMRGALADAGRRVGFTGAAWLDHQWGNFAAVPQALRWDWFSCRFDDGSELMLYRFRDGVRDGTFVERSGAGSPVLSFQATAGQRILTAAGRRWPLDWVLSVSSPRLRLRLRSLARDQLVRGRLLPTFWEGAAAAAGTKTGVCFVEETS